MNKWLVTVLLLIPVCALATQVHESTLRESTIQSSKNDEIDRKAALSHVSPAEYRRFLEIIQDPMVAHDYRNLTPAEVLGTYAKNDKEREKYADIFVQQYHARVVRELLFQRAYDRSYRKFYPNEKVVAYNDHSSGADSLSGIISGDRIIAFTKTDIDGDFIKTALDMAISDNSIQLDIYFTNHPSNQKVNDWAKSTGIPFGLVKKRQITLNIDDGEYNKLSQYSLPLLGFIRAGKTTWLDTSS